MDIFEEKIRKDFENLNIFRNCEKINISKKISKIKEFGKFLNEKIPDEKVKENIFSLG
jgi:hypothetical protein